MLKSRLFWWRLRSSSEITAVFIVVFHSYGKQKETQIEKKKKKQKKKKKRKKEKEKKKAGRKASNLLGLSVIRK